MSDHDLDSRQPRPREASGQPGARPQTPKRRQPQQPASARQARPAKATPAQSERVLAELWTSQQFDRGALVDLAGRPLAVVFRGWPNRGPGPDFQQAILADADGRLLRGDVELHVDAADSWAHGYHRDPAYDGVILHIVTKAERAGPIQPVRLASGALVPTVAISLSEGASLDRLDTCRTLARRRPRRGLARSC